jgi:hypothetical protein
MGLLYDGTIYADASAALGIVKRRGIGKVRHIRTQSLCLQEAHATKRLGFEKIDGSRKPSDLMTKHLTDTLQQGHLEYINAVPTGGRTETAPALSNLKVEDRMHGTTGHDSRRVDPRHLESVRERVRDGEWHRASLVFDCPL